MHEIATIIQFIQDIGFVGVLIILAIPKLRQKIFGMNGYDIMKKEMCGLADKMSRFETRLSKHLDDEEAEMKEVHTVLSDIKSDIAFIKGKLEK